MKISVGELRRVISEQITLSTELEEADPGALGDNDLTAETILIRASDALESGTADREDIIADISASTGLGFKQASEVLDSLERATNDPNGTYYSGVRSEASKLSRAMHGLGRRAS